ncbi:MAG: DinB family protein [Desulfovibrio sp.]|nr:DinB family protein [Desulfovibrio sp.]
MSTVIRDSLLGSVQHSFGLMNAFMDACPDEVWTENFGGWPIWQQCYHCFSAMNFFLKQHGDPPCEALFPDSVGNLGEKSRENPSRQKVKDFALRAQEWALRCAQALDDKSLAENNEGLSARFGKDMTHAGTLALVASHTLYHLGICDAALRQRGLPGMF